MTSVWQAIDAEFADDPLSIEGSMLYPGRWHSAGTLVLYAAATESLAYLEKYVNLSVELRTIPHVMLEIGLPDDGVIDALEDLILTAPDWRGADPTQSRALGDRWVEHSTALALSVPSVLVESDRNLVFARRSPLFDKLHMVSERRFTYVPRLTR